MEEAQATATTNGAVNEMSAREAILSQVGKLGEKELTMPGPKGPVAIIVRELTGKQSKDFELAAGKKNSHALGYLLQQCIVDPESGKLLFDISDRGALEELGMATLKPIIEASQKLSGISDEDIEKAKQDLLQAPSNG